MCVGERGHDLTPQPHHARSIERVGAHAVSFLPGRGNHLLERRTVQVFHRDEVDSVAGAAAGVDGGEVAMRQAGCRACFLMESCNHLAVVGEI